MLVERGSRTDEPVAEGGFVNPAVPVLVARIKRVIGYLTADDVDHLGDGGALDYVVQHSRLSPLRVDTQAVEWRAGALRDGSAAIKIEAVMAYSGDRGLLALLAPALPGAPVSVEITDRQLIVAASGVVDSPEELHGPVRAAIARIERIVATQARHVARANAAALPLASLLLRRQALRRGAPWPATNRRFAAA